MPIYFLPMPIYFLPMPTYAPRQDNMPTYFWVALNIAIPMYKGGLNKTIQANIRFYKEPKHLKVLAYAKYNRSNGKPGCPARYILQWAYQPDQESPKWSISLTKPDCCGKQLQGQCNALYGAKYQQSFINPPETCIAKSMPYRDQPTALSK